MKSFRQHLLESKQVYEFKIKVVGEPTSEQIDKLKSVLERFTVESFSEGTRTPIQETQVDFPEHHNTNTTSFDVTLTYPATSFQVSQLAANALGVSECCIKVRNNKEVEEYDINHKYDQLNDSKALIGSDYDKENNQHLTGQSHVMSMLKELNKVKHQGTQYKGVNDQLLAKKSHVEKSAPSAKTNTSIGTTSAIGSKKITLPTANLGK
jgi:hypothetical protein